MKKALSQVGPKCVYGSIKLRRGVDGAVGCAVVAPLHVVFVNTR